MMKEKSTTAHYKLYLVFEMFSIAVHIQSVCVYFMFCKLISIAFFDNLRSKAGRLAKRGFMGAVSTHRTTNDDICHYHPIVTKAFCLLQAHFGSGLGEFLNNFSRKVIGRSDKHQSVGHVERGGILTNFSSTVISCVSCPGFSASLDADVLVDLKTIR